MFELDDSCRAGFAAGCFVLTSCAFNNDEQIKTPSEQSQILGGAIYVLIFDVTGIEGMPPRSRKAQADNELQERCVGPLMEKFNASVRQYEEDSRTNPGATAIALPVLGRTLDKDMSMCMGNLHLDGRIAWKLGPSEYTTEQLMMRFTSRLAESAAGNSPSNTAPAAGGCGSRGGAGYRLPSGKCASRQRR